MGTNRRVGLLTFAWLGVSSAIVGIWLMLGLGLALFTLGCFITVITLIALNEDTKKRSMEDGTSKEKETSR